MEVPTWLSLKSWSIPFRLRAGITHLDIDNKDPQRDCNCRFEQNVLFFQSWQVAMISEIMSETTDIVLVSAFIIMPKQLTVDGDTKFLRLTSRTNGFNNVHKNWKKNDIIGMVIHNTLSYTSYT